VGLPVLSVMVFLVLLHVGRLPLAISRIVSRNRILCEAAYTFKSWNVKETVVGQLALEYLNNQSLHTGYINYILHKTTIANKLKHAETRI